MMMERAKTAPAPEEEAKPEATSSKPAPASSQDRVVDLERRLNDLDSTLESSGSTDNQAVAKPAIVESHAAATPTAVERPKQAEQKQPTNPLLVCSYVWYTFNCGCYHCCCCLGIELRGASVLTFHAFTQ